ncbi:SDR family oxidoreductase [Roseobacter sp. HKCCD9010]|uniref:SDR family oxidoreductase n=1 Tax=unclassified Roseobacter TaxID=196798 RepID=UPI001492166E|nr:MULTISPECIES: SDR family oxidoreductase [unclassified Roseobacter]MBF9051032.1 SDR family oxidoreductase [Rhodobacterales bacterium HKCCD4356]NNV12801.1 SDR family oxidoreductase [Roseobacter sp. HKCCD7357]NNV16746.1 SDR family oxidoreductase [Roseobacter sp. HKCCD8768]NNV26622.1 SDR family oxidoreductase [Roseobacter sp. HKCCD8192]NNV30466.1 SDR family oxidoreductase [Roseobacter sp. HKCCD9061]
MQLENKTILITGASSGIGKAAAHLFARQGARLVLGARRAPELSEIADEICKNGGKAVPLAGDVTDESYAQALVSLAQSKFGGLHGAFNNAGLMGEMGPVAKMATATWHTVLNTNLTSAFFAARAQIPALQSQGGAILFTSSFVGVSNGGMPGMAAYAASKAGLIGLVKTLAMEHGPEGIRINALLPGGTRTPMAGDDPDGHAVVARLHPLRRLAEPKEIAATAAFLLSDDASFITGAPILADGGVSTQLL